MSRISFGQPVEACPTTDKWALLNALTEAAEVFGLGHRPLSVLRALLTFYPDRALPTEAGAGVVYPSNRTLSKRLNGMPESTLRRHLAALVKSGLIARKDSANRKRFARFGGVAFGFDLSPLARAAVAIQDAATEAQARQEEIDALRCEIGALRQHLVELGGGLDVAQLLEDCRLALRRKVTPEQLNILRAALVQRLEPVASRCASDIKLSGSDSQNERHIQNTDKSESVMNTKGTECDFPLRSVIGSCHEYRSFFEQDCNDWNALLTVSERLYPMMGITREVYVSARSALGPRRLAATILCMLEILSEIKCPGAYLRALCIRERGNTFDLSAMLKRARDRRLSADNPDVPAITA